MVDGGLRRGVDGVVGRGSGGFPRCHEQDRSVGAGLQHDLSLGAAAQGSYDQVLVDDVAPVVGPVGDEGLWSSPWGQHSDVVDGEVQPA